MDKLTGGKEMNKGDICLITSGIVALIAFAGLDGGAFTCGQALLALLPAVALLLMSFNASAWAWNEPTERGRCHAESKPPIR